MRRTRSPFGLLLVVGMLLFPGSAAAQYVPVIDQTLIDAFNRFSNEFGDFRLDFQNYRDTFDDTFNTTGGYSSGNPITTGTSDSIRDLISGSNPGGIALEPCKAGDASDKVYAPSRTGAKTIDDSDWIYGHWAEVSSSATTSTSPWLAAIKYAESIGAEQLPEKIPDPDGKSAKTFKHERPQVNTSNSLRCLLKELVEWKKLDLSIQIHMLLKQYISDAQAQRLANQAQSQIAAAELNFASQGHCVRYPDGREECSPLIFTQDYVRQESDNIGRVLANRIIAPPDDPKSMNVPTIFQREAAEQAVALSGAKSLPASAAVGVNSCEAFGPTGFLANEDEYENFVQSGFAHDAAGQGLSPNLGFFQMNNNPGCYRLGAVSEVSDAYLAMQEETQQEMIRDAEFGNGVLPTRQVQNDGSDISLYSDKPVVQTGDANSVFFRRPSDVTFSTLAQCNSVDGCPATSTQEAAPSIASYGGALGYNRYDLRDTQNAVHATVKELYDTIWYGYFDLHTYTAEWAQAAMLKIYDTMKFNDVRPGVTVSDLPDPGSPNEYEIPPGF